MRVVGGTARGRLLVAPRGSATRPTSDRVREAMFSMLESDGLVKGRSVLDLFAGSGALGIEALSRGASSATLVERDARAIATISRNLAALGENSCRARVVGTDVFAFLAGASTTGAFFDLVVADPPYAFLEWKRLLGLLEGRAGVVVAEAGEQLAAPAGWKTVKTRRYSSTVVSVVRHLAEGEL
jgi:16S rRNA (guanine966-N2)-methyltransferase